MALSVHGMVVNVGRDLLLGRVFVVAGLAAATTASFLLVASAEQVVALHARHRAVKLAAVCGRLGALRAGRVGRRRRRLAHRRLRTRVNGSVPTDLAVLALAGAGCLAFCIGTLACLGGPQLAEFQR